MVAIGTHLYIFGGKVDGTKLSNELWSYDTGKAYLWWMFLLTSDDRTKHMAITSLPSESSIWSCDVGITPSLDVGEWRDLQFERLLDCGWNACTPR